MCVLHCSVCGKQTVQKEQFNHLILDLPREDDSSGSNGSNGAAASLFGSLSGSNRAPVADLSALLANHFNAETCEKACEGCGAAEVQHQVQHAVRRLPRVLVVQLKRFKWVVKDGFMECRWAWSGTVAGVCIAILRIVVDRSSWSGVQAFWLLLLTAGPRQEWDVPWIRRVWGCCGVNRLLRCCQPGVSNDTAVLGRFEQSG
jgi:hypothetical protein